MRESEFPHSNQQRGASFLEFHVAGKSFLLASREVREVALLPELSTLEGLPAAIAGFYPGAEQLIPVLDLALLVELPCCEITAETSLIFMEAETSRARQFRYALLVDGIKGFVDANSGKIDAAPNSFGPGGICPQAWVHNGECRPVLDPGRLVDSMQRVQMHEWAAAAQRRGVLWETAADSSPPAALTPDPESK